jgi:hypothetical protein
VAEVVTQSDRINKGVIVFKICIVVVIGRQITSSEDGISSFQNIIGRVTGIRVIGGLILFDDLLGVIPDAGSIANTLGKIS